MKDSSSKYIAYLLIGSNLGDRFNCLSIATELIKEQCGVVINQSSIYQTVAWGLTEQPDFLNQVLAVQTKLEPKELMLTLLAIEEKMGRVRTIKMGPRIIDLDILLIDELIMNTPLVVIPHPALADRRFALLPLAEVAPNLFHPVEKKTIIQLLHSCKDNLDVQKITSTTN
jgi:2-amino-4-hydroxy-6-hydroxymethyldihydropteridine diphosphokinase